MNSAAHGMRILSTRNPTPHACCATHCLHAQGVANVVWALGRLGHFSHGVLERALEVYMSKPESFKPQETCNLLSGLAALRYHPQAAFPVFVKSLAGRAGALRPMDFAALFHAFGTFAVHPGRELLGKLVRGMEQQLHKFGARELCSCYWGLALIVSGWLVRCLQLVLLVLQMQVATGPFGSCLAECGLVGDVLSSCMLLT